MSHGIYTLIPRLGSTIIGLMGKAGSGKNTVADILSEHVMVRQMSFAGPIKLCLDTLIQPEDPWAWEDREWKETPLPDLGISPRKLVQTLGTEWGRALHPDFWIKIAERRYQAIQAGQKQVVVFTDVRFANEARWIREVHNGSLIEVVGRGEQITEGDHASEEGTGVTADIVLQNTRTIDDLVQTIRQLLLRRPL